MLERKALFFAAAAATCILHASDAPACGVAYPAGSFAKFSTERSLIVWDASKKTEHFIRALSLKGDPESFGVFVPTPTVPKIAKEDDAIVDRVAQLLVPPTPPIDNMQGGSGGGPRGAVAVAPPPVQVMQRTQIGDFEAVTLKAVDANALGDWLSKNNFIDKPALRTWEKNYLEKKWFITAVRCTAKGTGDRTLEVPTMRMSFQIDAPFFPYVEVPAEASDERAYRTKYAQGGGYNYATRQFEVYVIAPAQMQAMLGEVTGGPPVADAVRVTSDSIATALGDTKSWGFDPKSQPRWTVTKLAENVWQRTADKDLTFASYDLPKARPGPGVSEVDDRPTGPTFPGSSMAWMEPGSASTHGKKSHTRFRLAAIALFFLIAGAAGYAVMSEQEKKQKAKS